MFGTETSVEIPSSGDTGAMDSLYTALKEVKDEVDHMALNIQQEEDIVSALEVSIREQEEKNKRLKSKLIHLEMDAQTAQSNYKIGVLKKEVLEIEIKGLKYQIEDIQKKVEEKESGLQQLADLFAEKEQELLELQMSQHATYMEIPSVKAYIEASELCAARSETVAKLTDELNSLKAKYGPLPGSQDQKNEHASQRDSFTSSQKDVFCSQKNRMSTMGVIQLESSGSQVSPEMKGIQEILGKFAELAEENRILKFRLERLEMANQVSFPRENEKNASGNEQVTTLPAMAENPTNDKNAAEVNFQNFVPVPKKITFSIQKDMTNFGVAKGFNRTHSQADKENTFFDNKEIEPKKATIIIDTDKEIGPEKPFHITSEFQNDNLFFGKEVQLEMPPSMTQISFGDDDCMTNSSFGASPEGSFF